MAIAVTYKLLASVRPANTSEAALILIGAGTEINGVLRVCNQDSQTRTYQVAHCAATGAATGEDWLAYDKQISANETHEYSIHANATEEIRIKASVADKISFNLSGMEKVTS